MKLTVKEYQDAILNAKLDPNEIEILKAIYKFPDSTANVKELAQVLGLKWRGLALRIGTIGRKIADYLGKYPENYITGGIERPAYFMFIGPYYTPEGKSRSDRIGWEMNENLRKALEILKLV